MHEGIRPLAGRGGEARQDDQGRQRTACVPGRGLQADREFQPGRNQDDQICRIPLREVRDSAADRRPAQERPQEHRRHAEKGLRDGAATAAKRTGWPEPERIAGLFGGASGGDPHQEGRQHLRYAERQRSRAMTSRAAARVADATGNWVDTRAPSWSRPYLRLSRLDRPIGSWLLLMPCWWSAALAAGVIGSIGQLPLILVLFFIGAFVMRGAGCTWNDITDRDLDALVERTRSRPIPAGQVSVPQAMVFLVVQALIGLAVLLQFNRFAVATGIASLVIVAIYPFMKRITWWPQIVLGLAFSWGALMGFAATLGRIDATALALYAGSTAWVIGYDTIYAHQDADDDALIGVKSTARLFGPATHRALVVFYSLAVVLIGVALMLGGARWPAWIGLIAFAAHLVWQIRRLDIGDPELCKRIFYSNRDAGLLLFAGLLVDAVMRAGS